MMGIQLKIMKMNRMIERINIKIESLKSTLEEDIIAAEVEILSQHRDRLIISVNRLRVEIGVC